MNVNPFELHPDRLSTTDSVGKRIFLHPADVRGYFRKHRTRVQNFLILFLLVLPWIKIQGRQALLLDLAQRRFEIFGLSLRAHNAPLLIFVLLAAAFGLLFSTAVFGRIWCGWACPQTVFIDGVFRRIERWVEGASLSRKQLDQAPWTLDKVSKKILKWSLFVLTTLIITHSVMAYFVGTDQLEMMMQRPPSEHWGNFLFMIVSSGLILFNFGWFREQFCTIICPYGRFQSVLMDQSSMTVAYNGGRGEPRATPQAKAIAKTHNSRLGDCVNCYRCVQVCPTGIDIRRGLQMECIACTACMDACDEVMTKIKKPTGLIRYRSNRPVLNRILNFRSSLYLGLCLASLLILGILLAHVRPVNAEVFRAKDTPYSVQEMADGSKVVINHFKVELSNQSGAEHALSFSLPSELQQKGFQLITAMQAFPMNDGQLSQVDLFIRFPKQLLIGGESKIQLLIEDKAVDTGAKLEIGKELGLVGPF